MQAFAPQTNAVSFALLRELFEGHGIAPLYGIVDAVCGEIPLERIDEHVSQLTRVGHSSGWDVLAGLLTGLLFVNRSPQNAWH